MSSEGKWEGAELPPFENHCFNLMRPSTGFTMRRTHKRVVTRLPCRSKTFAHRVMTSDMGDSGGQHFLAPLSPIHQNNNSVRNTFVSLSVGIKSYR